MNGKREAQPKKLVYVKIGSSSAALTNDKGEVVGIDADRLSSLTDGVVDLRQHGYDVVIVTSGAVAAGQPIAGFTSRPTDPADLSRCAALGQHRLMTMYEELLSPHGYHASQVLVERSSYHELERRAHILGTRKVQLDAGDVVCINENDSVVSTEMRFGDNDFVCILDAIAMHAYASVSFTDNDGVLTADPKADSSATLIQEIDDVTEEIYAGIGANGSLGSMGGTLSKVFAADIGRHCGVQTYIANIDDARNVRDIIEGRNMNRTRFALKPTAPVDLNFVCEVIDAFAKSSHDSVGKYFGSVKTLEVGPIR